MNLPFVNRPGHHRALLFTVLAILALSLRALAADDFTGKFDAANKLYEQGRFSEAATAYETLVQAGSVSPALYFNLGNARYKSGQLGQAIAAYRRAGQLAPRDPDVRANLQFARNQVQNPTLPPNRWERWLGKLSLDEWTALTATTFWLCLLTLVLGQLRPAWKASLRNLALGSGLATVGLGICLASALSMSTWPVAIVAVHDGAIRSGPLDEAQTVLTVHDGAELAVLDTKDNWLQVSAGQRSGWVKRGQVLQFPSNNGN